MRRRALLKVLASLSLGAAALRAKPGLASASPDGLFIVHHGVGSEEWSADGFTRVSRRG